jgi:hypothetical protein
MTSETDLNFTTINFKFKFCLILVYGAGCCGNSDEASDSLKDGDFLDSLSGNRLTEEKPSAKNCEYYVQFVALD